MARREQDREYEPRIRRKRAGKGKYLLGIIGLTSMLLLVYLPTLVARRSIVVPLINRFGGIAPLRVELEGVQAGWFKPVGVKGFQLFDADGHLVARIDQIETEKGIWSWIRDSAHLGTIRISHLESAVVAFDGTTNIERALQPLLDQMQSGPEQDAASAGANMTGTIEFLDSKFLLVEQNRPEQWVIAMPLLTLALPAANQLIGPIKLQATMAEVSGTAPVGAGTLSANVHQADAGSAFEMRAKIDQLPVQCWHVLRARLPDMPVEELHGRISAQVSGQILDSENWSFDIQHLESRDLQVVAPELVGEHPAKLDLISAAGRTSLANSMLKIEGVSLTCDFASATASASLPWPLEMPTVAEPFWKGGVLDARGSLDLPKLVLAADTLLPLREDTQLLAGHALFAVSQVMDEQGAPTSRAKLELSGLQAIASGQKIRWNDPLNVEVAANRGKSGVRVGAMASAEFCSIKAGGTIEAGQIEGKVDLDLLQKRLSEYIELPIRTMHGSANVEAGWEIVADQTVQAAGQLITTPLVIASTAGGEVQEPAWNGNFTATVKLNAGSPERLERAQLTLESSAEQLTIDLQETLWLVTPEGATPAQPAAFTINLVGDLANWKRRGTMWLTEPPELTLSGNLNLAAGGRIDLTRVEILHANWSSQPLEVSTPQMSFAEPQMVGNFKGRVDTNDLTRLVVEKLEVQSTSFSLGARDSANPDGSGSRIGQAMFLLDLDRLMKSVNSPASGPVVVLPPGTSADAITQYSATGRVQGQVAWQVSPHEAAVEVQANGENIVVLSKASQTAVPQPLWQEPKMTAVVKGIWLAESNDVNIEALQLQMPWMNYAGNLAYRTVDQLANVKMKGQAVYDSVQLTSKLTPMVGDQFQLYGQQTVPIEVEWTGSNDPNRSMLAGLKAVTRVGWERAVVAGIRLGKADVPVLVEAGQLATAAEFPVSGGKLRWDITSDLTAQELVIRQKPMTVLENVQITEQMCQGWLKYVTPLLAEATRVDGRLSVRLDQAQLTPAEPKKQTVVGQLVIHNATVGPGPLSNQVISLVKQVDAIRKKDFTQAVSTQNVWMDMPEQRIDFQMVNGRVSHQNLNVRVGDAEISTVGSVSVDGQLDITASMPIPDDWIQKSPLLAGMRGQSLQFPLRGTLAKPQMDSDALRQFSRQAVQSATTGVIQQGLSRGLEKLFGGQPPSVLSPPTGN